MTEDMQTLSPIYIAEIAEKRRQSELLVKLLGPRNPIRQIALDTLNGDALSPESIELLLATTLKSSDSRWKERAIAAWALGEQTLSADQALVVAQSLSRMLENKQIGKVNRLFRRLFRAGARTLLYMGILLLAALLFKAFYESAGVYVKISLSSLMGILALVIPFVPPFSLHVDVRRNNAARAMAAWSLGRLGVPKTFETLARTAMSFSAIPPVSVEVSWALGRILPLVGAEHYGQLERQTVPDLCALLLYDGTTHPLRLIIMETLEKIGDARAIAPVERLIKQSASPGVQQSARRLLLLLHERRRQENESKVLLRASSFEDASGDTLLRAASGASITDPQTLLRASLNDESDDNVCEDATDATRLRISGSAVNEPQSLLRVTLTGEPGEESGG